MSVSPTEQYDVERRGQFAFSFLVASLPLVFFGIALCAQGLWLPFGLADILFGIAVLGIRRWTLAVPGVARFNAGCIAIGVLGLGIIGWHAMFTGQSASFALWYLPCMVVVTALLATARLAMTFAVLGAALALVVLASEQWLHIEPSFVVSSWLFTLCQLMLLGVISAYSIAARLTTDAHVGRLEAARREADAANQAKSNFLAVMSHEIRTPLNGVIGLNSLLLTLPLDDKARHYAEQARLSGEALLAQVNDFLDFSKIEAGHMELLPIAFDPRKVMQDALATVQESARSKQLQLAVSIDAPPALRGDATRLRQILVNLLGNAVKFTAAGSVVLQCRALPRAGGQVDLDIEVRDTGIGMDATTRARLFRPFSQGDASTTRVFGGTGLGLAICHALAELMGGRIAVDSQPGVGSTFRVTLPFAVSAERVPSTAPVPAITPQQPRGRVLVAEDNPVNQLVAAEMLGHLGMSVDVVADGHSAIEAALQGIYDLVLMDCEMPLVDGFEASRTIRAREVTGGRRVPIVAMTASALRGDRERCLAAGMDDYLAKPVRLAEVERVARNWLARHRRPDPA